MVRNYWSRGTRETQSKETSKTTETPTIKEIMVLAYNLWTNCFTRCNCLYVFSCLFSRICYRCCTRQNRTSLLERSQSKEHHTSIYLWKNSTQNRCSLSTFLFCQKTWKKKLEDIRKFKNCNEKYKKCLFYHSKIITQKKKLYKSCKPCLVVLKRKN